MIRKIARTLCICIIIICLYNLYKRSVSINNDISTYKDLRLSTDITNTHNDVNSTHNDIANIVLDSCNTLVINPINIEMDDRYKNLYSENNDLVGWISNSDKIDYPIMQRVNDSNYYLDKDFYERSSISGSIYIPSDVTLNDKIVPVYGHNMKNDTMFGTLRNYLNKEYLEDNKIFKVSNLYMEYEYEVIGAFVSQVYDENYKEFKYYSYRGNVTKSEFQEYKKGIEPLMITGDISKLSYDDNIIELITCWYSFDNARLVILCRKLK